MKCAPSMSRPRMPGVYLLCFSSLVGGACSSATVAASSGGSGGNVGDAMTAGTGGKANADAGGALLVIPDAGQVDACVPIAASAACAPQGAPIAA
jgi:hypothetical protein